MPLKITGRHMTVSESTRDYIDKKVDRLRRLVPKIDEISFTLAKEKLLIDIEANFRAGKVEAHARTRAEHVNEAIDQLVDKLEAQIAKTRKKITDKSSAARESAKIADAGLVEDKDLAAEIAEEQESEIEDRLAAGG
jgi:putative sigma-54 modulation protein